METTTFGHPDVVVWAEEYDLTGCRMLEAMSVKIHEVRRSYLTCTCDHYASVASFIGLHCLDGE